MKILRYRNIILATVLFVGFTPSTAQEILTKTEAVALALEYNFDIRTANNNVAIAENNASVMNSGYLPSISGTGSASFSFSDVENTLQNGEVQSVDGVQSTRYNGSMSLSYTLFDGLGRAYNFQKLKDTYQLSELQARLVIENSLLNIFTAYYEVARLSQNIRTQRRSLDISGERLTRAKYSSDYGQNTQLDLLNAEVDYNNDSISYLTILQQLENQKRNLNLLIGRDVQTKFMVDTTITYTQGLHVITLLDDAKMTNINILQEQALLINTQHDERIAKSATIPKIGLTAAYNYSLNDFGATSFFDKQNSIGTNLGATLTWNLFDGGLTKTRKQNTVILMKNQQLNLERTQLETQRNVSNAWTIYQTALFVLEAEKKNLETNHRNFNRTQEQYTLGQVTSIEFRQAQLNYLNASLNYNQAKYSAKVAELTLLQLSGGLLLADF
ncbi:MAG: TolC family protein [Cyclobacteriaceae bacterium]|nr:TolC family protein [Cyclobacteriaceae bacterium]